ncbi:hypothetical protein FJ365_03445 [Candidatus Dependentiae bacterium]|nr:hypothetical protein [Candidatus Dependentiae bacterium]
MPFSACVLAICLFTASLFATPTITVSQRETLLDEPITITLSGMPVKELITFRATCTDMHDQEWSSHAVFETNDTGEVDLTTQSPIEGSYEGADSMGLFWSILPKEKLAQPFKMGDSAMPIRLVATCGEEYIAEATMVRLPMLPTVERREIREEELVGTLFFDKTMGPQPGIVVLGGADGGIYERMARWYASHGFAAFALGYFGVDGLPSRQERIELTNVLRGIEWFKKQPEVLADHIAIHGTSKGGELALLLGSFFPNAMQAIIACVPSMHIQPGGNCSATPWLLHGSTTGLPHTAPCSSHEEYVEAARAGSLPRYKSTFDRPCQCSRFYLFDMKRFPEEHIAAEIPVENIQCPLLITSGEDDHRWPSAHFGTLIMNRLEAKGSTINRTHLCYLGAGHYIPTAAYNPSSDHPEWWGEGLNCWLSAGGTAAANAHAAADARSAILAFLGKHL